jgi:hypothetical protein
VAINLASKPGLTGATALSIPKDWSAAWFRGFINNLLKGADVRNAIGANGIKVTGNIASPYATIGLGTPAGLSQSGSITQGSGVPSNANGNNGDYYFRTDTPGTANQRIYVKSAGVWTGIV